MKRSGKQLSSKENVVLLSKLIALGLGQNIVKGLKVTKTFKKIRFDEVWGKIESKKGFQRQSVIKHFTLTLVFM